MRSDEFPPAQPDELIASRTLNARCEQVFAAITDPVLLARWWGPKGFTNTFERFEFCEGGDWIFTMHGPDGASYPNELVEIHHVNAPVFKLTILLSSSLSPRPRGCRLGWRQRFETVALCQTLTPLIGNKNEENLDRLELVLASTFTN